MFSNKKKQLEIEEAMSSNNIIGKGTLIKGDINASSNIRIDGKIIGNIFAKSKVVIGESGEIDGNINSNQAEISGFISGDIEVLELVILHASANIKGNIITNKLIIESGAIFNGSCKMISEVKKINLPISEQDLYKQIA
ncbi:MAG: polymer-forming cytoskeletal protein [Cytophagales bacterium]|nr:MAG: polymer-forming cytoskeletal protein [Cytophagales bacterium]